MHINYLNDTLENAIIGFYEDESELNKINQDEDCLFYDIFFKKETGISLLEKNGFLKIIKQNQNHYNTKDMEFNNYLSL